MTSAKFQVRLFGQTLPDIPILVHTNGSWKLGLDINVAGGVRLAGKQNQSFSAGFSPKGMTLNFSARFPITPNDVLVKCEQNAKVMHAMAGDIRARKYDSAHLAAEAFNQALESIFQGSAATRKGS
jgi:hypothetical protein